ncbi:MAG: response regulator [Anaerolineae bacterium]
MAKILIVDDDPDFVEITRLMLEQAGHQVVEAANGKEGFTRAKEEKPDLIILDVIMDTVLEGVSISQQMHDDPELHKTPIIMVTSIANTDYAELFPTDEYIHIDAFMSKPITPAGLLRQIDRLLAR